MAADGALARGMAVLEEVVCNETGIGVTEVAERCGIDKSSASRVLATLRDLGYVQQRPADRRYVPGSRALWLAEAFRNANLALTAGARPHLEALRDETGETVHLAGLDGSWVVYLDQVDSGRTVTVQSAIGTRLPLSRTAMGRAVLAALSPAARQKLLRRLLPAEEGQDAEVRATLEADIAAATARGWAGVDRHDDVTRLAAAIVDVGGAPVAALALSGPSYRVDPRIGELGPAVASAARAISATVGGGRTG